MIGVLQRAHSLGFVVAFALAMVGIARSPHAEAQQKAVPRIGYLRFIAFPPNDEVFRKGLYELGYVEGQNIRVEYRQAGANVERVRQLADELVSLKVDVLVAASTQAVEATRRATKTIPIVFPVTFDPVESGFVGQDFQYFRVGLFDFHLARAPDDHWILESLPPRMPGCSAVLFRRSRHGRRAAAVP